MHRDVRETTITLFPGNRYFVFYLISTVGLLIVAITRRTFEVLPGNFQPYCPLTYQSPRVSHFTRSLPTLIKVPVDIQESCSVVPILDPRNCSKGSIRWVLPLPPEQLIMHSWILTFGTPKSHEGSWEMYFSESRMIWRAIYDLRSAAEVANDQLQDFEHRV